MHSKTSYPENRLSQIHIQIPQFGPWWNQHLAIHYILLPVWFVVGHESDGCSNMDLIKSIFQGNFAVI